MLEKFIGKNVFINFINSNHSPVRAEVIKIDGTFIELKIKSESKFIFKSININAIFSIMEIECSE